VFFVELTHATLSLPGLTGRCSKYRPRVLDCPVKPGNDTNRVSMIEKRANHRAALCACGEIDPAEVLVFAGREA
jgi:hypothetical protein